MYIQDNFKKCLKLQYRDITYKVNEEKGVVVALAYFYTPLSMEVGANQYINTIGIARLNKRFTTALLLSQIAFGFCCESICSRTRR